MRNGHAQKIVICCAQIALLVIELLIFCEMVIVVIVMVLGLGINSYYRSTLHIFNTVAL